MIRKTAKRDSDNNNGQVRLLERLEDRLLLSTIGDRVWSDLNLNGLQDIDEPGQEGIQVNLLDSGGAVINSVTSGINGEFAFTVPAGQYSLQVTAPGFSFSPLGAGLDATADSDLDPATGQTALFTVPDAVDMTDIDIGLRGQGDIGGRVWDDLNGDGLQDVAEVGLDGVDVELYNAAGDLLAITTTANGGFYGFTALGPGVYNVLFVQPTQRWLSPANVGADDTLDSDADPATAQAPVVLTAGGWNFTTDAGLTATPPGPVLQPGSDTGVQGDGITGVNVLTFDVSDPLYHFFIDGVEVSGGAVSGPFTTGVLTDGPHTFAIASDDGAGNLSALSPAVTVTVDTIPPVAPTVPPQNVLQGSPGLSGTGEPGSTVTVTVNGASYTVTVDALGNWTLPPGLINPITPGVYDVAVVSTDAAGNQAVDVTTNEVTVSVAAIIGDRVWSDLNLNGLQDINEPGVEGVQLQLYDSTGLLVASTTSGIDGSYTFSATTGSYYIVATAIGYQFSPMNVGLDPAFDSNADPLTGQTALFSVVNGQVLTDIDIGMRGQSDISGLVWSDANGNGLQDLGELGVDGVAVELYNNVGDLLAITTTAGGGFYAFNALGAGSYVVAFVPTTGWFSPANVGADDTIDSDALPATGLTSPIILPAGAGSHYVDAGLTAGPAAPVLQPIYDTGTPGDGITGVNVLVFDVSEPLYHFYIDGVQVTATPTSGPFTTPVLADGVHTFAVAAVDGLGNVSAVGAAATVTVDTLPPTVPTTTPGQTPPGSPGLSGTAEPGTTVTITINGQTITVVADAAGNWTIPPGVLAQLPPGFYDVVVTSTDAAGNVTSDVTTNEIEVLAGTFIGDRVWNDRNANGIQDAGERGVSGVTVQLLDTLGAVVATTTTDVNGNYFFDALPGSYQIAVTAAGYQFTLLQAGVDPTLDSDIDPATGTSATFTIAAGQVIDSLDAGLIGQGQIAGWAWNDLNNNGLQDAGEPGFDGATVNLYDSVGNLIETATTAGGGLYSFASLGAGTFVVEFVAGNVFWFSPANVGADDTIDSDVDPATGRTAAIALAAGGSSLNVDAGLTATPPAPDLRSSYDTGSSSSDNITKASVLIFDVAPALYHFYIDGVQVTAVPQSGEFVTPSLADGVHTFAVAAVDGLGNVSGQSPALSVTVDTIAPAIPTVVAKTAPAGSPGLSGTAEVGTTVNVTVNGSTYPAVVNVLGNWSIAPGVIAPLGAGVYDVTVVSTDVAGNSSTDVTSNELTINSTINVTVATRTTSDTSPELHGTVDSVIATVTVTVNGVTYTATNVGDGTWVLPNNTITPALLPGVYDVAVSASDGLGNSGTDNTVDELTITVASVAVTVNPVYTDNPSPGLSGTVADPAAVVTVTVDGVQYPAVNTNGNWAIAPGVVGPLGSGTYDVQAVATVGGNVVGSDTTTGELVIYTPGSVGDLVWDDLNGNGLQDAGEPGIDGVTVQLLQSGVVVDSAVTAGGGLYSFAAVAPGAYRLHFVAPAGYDFTLLNAGADNLDSDANSGGLTASFVVAEGVNADFWDAGLVAVAPGEQLQVIIGDGMESRLYFVDADGTLAQIRYRGGQAQINFSGVGLASTVDRGKVYVTGADISVESIDLVQTSTRSKLQIRTKNGDVPGIEIGSITSDGDIRSIDARDSDIVGAGIILNGEASSIRIRNLADATQMSMVAPQRRTSITAYDIRDADVQFTGVGGARSSVRMKVKQVSNVQLTSGSDLSIQATEWIDDDGIADVITAPSMRTLKMSGQRSNLRRGLTGRDGDFQADLVLNGDPASRLLNSARISGSLTDADWAIGGQAGTIRVGMRTVGANLNFVGDVRSIQTGTLEDSCIGCGLADPMPPLPADASSILLPAVLNRLRVSGFRGGPADQFVDSCVSAMVVKRADLGVVADGAGGRFGVAACDIGRVTLEMPNKISVGNASTPQLLFTSGDMVVQVV